MRRDAHQQGVTMRRQVTLTILIGWFLLLGLIGLNMPSPGHAQPGRFGEGPGAYDFRPDRLNQPDRPEHYRPPGQHGPGGRLSGRFIERQAERLGLDEKTRSSIRAIADTSHAKGKEIRKSLHQAHREMRELLQRDTPAEEAVLQQAEKIGTLEIEAQQNRLQAMLQIRALLTPEQRQEIIQLRKEDHPHGWRRGRRRGRRRGQAFRACQENAAQLCPDAAPGRSSIQCLNDNWDALSDECHAFFEREPERDFRRHGKN